MLPPGIDWAVEQPNVGQAWVVARWGSDISTVVGDDLTGPSDDPRECVAATRAQAFAYPEIAQLEAYVRSLRGTL